jgi:hypothetical protein
MQKTCLLWVFLIGFCMMTASGASAQATAAGRIILARVTGEVTVLDKATAVSVAGRNNQEITQGFTVSTGKGASVVMVFSNGATINLKEDSVLDVEKYLQDPFAGDFNPSTATDEPTVSNTGLNLTRGELVGNVKKLKTGQGSTFNVQTPVGAAGIRGTTFRIVYRPTGTGTAFFSLTTTEGNVVLSTGTITLPVGAVDNLPKEVVIDAQVDVATGVVTITTPTATITVVTAATSSVAAVTESRAEVVQAVAAVVFAPPAAVDPAVKAAEDKAAADRKAAEDKAAADRKAAEDKAAADKKAAEEKAAAEKASASPPPVAPPPTLTSGAGGT